MKQLMVMVVALGSVAMFAHRSDAAGGEERGVADDEAVQRAEAAALSNLGLKGPPQDVVVEEGVVSSKVCPQLTRPGHGTLKYAIGSDGNLTIARTDAGGTFVYQADGVTPAMGPDGMPKKTPRENSLSRCGLTGSVWSKRFPPEVVVGGRNGIGLAADDAGNTYYGYVSQASHGGALKELGIAKLDDAGKQLWKTNAIEGQVAAIAQAFDVHQLLVGQDGVYVFGFAASQLPRQPADARGQNFIAKFSTDGKLTWLRQAKEFGQTRVTVYGDETGGVLLGNHQQVVKVAPDGKTSWVRQGQLVGAGDKGSYYTTGGERHGVGPTARFTLFVRKTGAGGKLLWEQTYESPQSKTLDPIEGVVWQSYPQVLATVQSGSTVYLVGGARNQYQHGSMPRAPHNNALVLAVQSDTGKLKWARQYRVGPVPSPQDNVALMQPTFWPLADGGLTIAGEAGPAGGKNPTSAFQIKPNGQPTK